VASIAAGFHNLRILSISGCAEVDDEGLIALGLWADELTEINLGNLPKVCLCIVQAALLSKGCTILRFIQNLEAAESLMILVGEDTAPSTLLAPTSATTWPEGSIQYDVLCTRGM
jgi:hypothetical protein